MCDWTEWRLIEEREKLEKARAGELKRLNEAKVPARKQEKEQAPEPQPDAVPV
jgi:hypothetical protein